jgi:hypothetical protein
VNPFVDALQAQADRHLAIMVLVRMVEFPFVLMKEIVLGVLHPVQMTKGQLLLNVLLIKLHRMQ